jgi:hypothetical protein
MRSGAICIFQNSDMLIRNSRWGTDEMGFQEVGLRMGDGENWVRVINNNKLCYY